MKSAFDLAMERYGSEPIQKLTEKQKSEIGEINSIYKAKIAEAQVMHQEKLKKAMGNVEEREQAKSDLAVEIASLNEKSEKEKEQIRNGNG